MDYRYRTASRDSSAQNPPKIQPGNRPWAVSRLSGRQPNAKSRWRRYLVRVPLPQTLPITHDLPTHSAIPLASSSFFPVCQCQARLAVCLSFCLATSHSQNTPYGYRSVPGKPKQHEPGRLQQAPQRRVTQFLWQLQHTHHDSRSPESNHWGVLVWIDTDWAPLPSSPLSDLPPLPSPLFMIFSNPLVPGTQGLSFPLPTLFSQSPTTR